MTTVLVIAEDLGFQFWLAEALAEAGFFVVPAQSPAKARKLLARIGCPVDVAVFDPELTGAGDFIERLQRSQGYLHVVSLSSPRGELSQAEWVARVCKSMSLSASA